MLLFPIHLEICTKPFSFFPDFFRVYVLNIHGYVRNIIICKIIFHERNEPLTENVLILSFEVRPGWRAFIL